MTKKTLIPINQSTKMKTIGLIFIVVFLIFPSVRYTTGTILHSTANLIQSTTN